MTHAQAVELLKELTERLDYDMYKEMFVYPDDEECNEDEWEDTWALVDDCVAIILKHTKENI